MLNKIEWEQISVALDAMHAVKNEDDSDLYVKLHNVKAVLQRWSTEYYENAKLAASKSSKSKSKTNNDATGAQPSH
jgi:hypothetical protein